MRLNNKGFAISSIMYIILIMCIILITVTLSILSSRNLILDKQKRETLNGIYNEEVYNSPSIPELIGGLTPVVYQDNNWKVADTSKEWYNYSKQEWANAVILNTDVSKNAGATVDVSSEVKAMLVYIPRYEYKIEGQYGKGGTSATSPGEIEVNFITKDKTQASAGYRVHPAFTFGSEELNGIWVGKFETSHTTLSSSTTNNNLGCSNENCTNADGLRILPNVASLRYNNVSNMFYAVRSMTRSGNGFGLSSSNVDSHMMKNSEWGAVAYLSQSKYGKYGNSMYTGANKEIYQNKSSSYITGNSNGTPSQSSSNTQCEYNNITDRGSGTGSCGGGASTTGNITGIYDMSGGAAEYVMGNYNSTIGSTGFSALPAAKYFDTYTTTTETTACNNGICYGQALSETSGWYSDNVVFVNSSSPWFNRGGGYNSILYAGVFCFYGYSGYADSNGSLRVVVS